MKGSVQGQLAVWLVVGSLLGLMAALLWLAGQAGPALADPGTRYVAVTGEDTTDCSNAEQPCRTVQFAVDAAGVGDLIKVAAGVYTEVHDYGGGRVQVLYISQTVTVRGGYTTTDVYAGPPDAEANETTLDAEGQGRVVYITGQISPMLEGLRLTGGDATGLGGLWGLFDSGGGVYVEEATATISGCLVVGNTASTARAGSGGGLHLAESAATLQGNTVVSNTASTALDGVGWGGGLYLAESAATLQGNRVQGNTASTASDGSGGGLSLDGGAATLQGNTVVSNTASTAGYGEGGGLEVNRSAATLEGNTVVRNTATLKATATGLGGGLAVYGSPFTLTNNLVAGNQANTAGGGLWFDGDSLTPTAGRLLHTTLADNTGSDGGGQGVFVGEYTTLALTNTLIAGHSGVGITVTAGSMATLEATLWHGNGAWTGGGGSIVTTIDVEGDPAFVDPAAWDYHLGLGSAAVDAGVAAGVEEDIDGDGRPQGAGYDIGADESVCVTGVAIDGPLAGIAGQTYDFTATVTPASASLPIIYTWSPDPDSGQGTALAAYTWWSGGSQTITVTATNNCGTVEASHTIDIASVWRQIYLPLITRDWP